MKPNARRLLERCIEDGIARGIHRAHKHVEQPSREHLETAITQAILHEVDEWFLFDEAENGN